MKPRIFFLTSHPMTVTAFLAPHLVTLDSHYNICVFANTRDVDLLRKRGINISVSFLPLVRDISFCSDFLALIKFYKILVTDKPWSLHTLTPKAGLIGMIAAWLARVPVRIHTFTGQVWITRGGISRWVLKRCDRLTALLSTHVTVDSHSQRKFLLDQKVLTEIKSTVFCSGSISGVDTNRFYPDIKSRNALRERVGTASETLVCLYLGRLNASKGLLDLMEAFVRISIRNPLSELWLVGPDESNIVAELKKIQLGCSNRIKYFKYSTEPENFMRSADLLCLPSYREGFGSVVIEAAACGVPALVSRIYGLSDSVVDGVTGWTHEAGNVNHLAEMLDALLGSRAKLQRAGQLARARIKASFEQRMLTYAMLQFYKKQIE